MKYKKIKQAEKYYSWRLRVDSIALELILFHFFCRGTDAGPLGPRRESSWGFLESWGRARRKRAPLSTTLHRAARCTPHVGRPGGDIESDWGVQGGFDARCGTTCLASRQSDASFCNVPSLCRPFSTVTPAAALFQLDVPATHCSRHKSRYVLHFPVIVLGWIYVL